MVSVDIPRFGRSIGTSRGVRVLHKPVFPGASLDLDFVANRGYSTIAPGHGTAASFLSGSPSIDGSGLLLGNGDTVALASGVATLLAPAAFSIYVEWEQTSEDFSTNRPLFNAKIDATHRIAVPVTGTAGKVQVYVLNSTVSASLVSDNAVSSGTVYKIAFRIKADDFAAAYTATLDESVKADPSGGIPSGTYTELQFGRADTSIYADDIYMRRFAILPSLTDAGLSAMVA